MYYLPPNNFVGGATAPPVPAPMIHSIDSGSRTLPRKSWGKIQLKGDFFHLTNQQSS